MRPYRFFHMNGNNGGGQTKQIRRKTPSAKALLTEATLAVRLAAADFAHERRLSLCAILGLAAVLAPLLVLYGLKYGVVAHMSETLNKDPRARELRPTGHGVYEQSFFDALAARPDVGFVIPTTRFLSATVSLRRENGDGEPVLTELWPSKLGDPFLIGVLNRALAPDEVALSAQTARTLRLSVGDAVIARIGRRLTDQDQSVRTRLRVAAVLPVGLIERDVAFAPLGLLLATEDYREGYGSPTMGWPGAAPDPQRPRTYSSFRIFAADLNGVASVNDFLATNNIAVLTRLADIQTIRNLDDGLSVLFTVIAGLGVAGYIFSLYVNLAAMVERKQVELATLQLIGFSSVGIALFPTVNAALTAIFGSIAASLIYLGLEPILNDNLFIRFGSGVFLTHLSWSHLLIGAGLSLAVCLTAAAFAGAKAAKLEPARGLRDV